ncbi:MAG: hypothetical protein WAU91_22260 [Desulfatitalea sp.]
MDDFFGEKSAAPPPPPAGYSLQKLKSAILSIDWEITDACLTDLIDESEALLPHFENDPITHALLRMLRALGRYIRKRKARSHQDAIKRVMSVFSSLETLISNGQLGQDQKRRIVAKEIQAFKKLKEQVEAQKSVKYAAAPAAERKQEPNDPSALLEHHKFKQAMNAVEERLGAKVKELKAQMATMQKELNTMRKS